jgi:hypothetical protein
MLIFIHFTLSSFRFAKPEELLALENDGHLEKYEIPENSVKIYPVELDSGKKEYKVELIPEEEKTLIYKKGRNLNAVQPGDGVLMFRKDVPLLLGQSAPMDEEYGENHILEMAQTSLNDHGNAFEISSLPMMDFKEKQIDVKSLEDMLLNNKKILDIIRYEKRDDDQFFSFSQGELSFPNFKEMNKKYLEDLGNIISSDFLPKYIALLQERHAEDPLKGGFSHESESSLTKKVNATIKDFQDYLNKNIFMISPIKRFYENQLQESLNIENMEHAILDKVNNGGMNLLAGAADFLCKHGLDFLELSVQNPWDEKTKIDDNKYTYLMKTMIENLYTHINENITGILNEQLSSEGANPIDRLNENLTHVIQHLNEKMIETFRKGWPDYYKDFDSMFTEPFLEKANIGKFFIKESLNSQIEDLEKFVEEYVDTTLTRTFFSNMVTGDVLNKDLFKDYMQLIDTTYVNERSVNAPLLEHSEMVPTDDRVKLKKKRMIVV